MLLFQGFFESTFLGAGEAPCGPAVRFAAESDSQLCSTSPKGTESSLISFSAPLPQIILAILVSWLLCFIFTVTDVFPPDSSKYGFYARTDARRGVLLVAPWFKVPYPCKCNLLPRNSRRVIALLPEALLALSQWCIP